MDIQFNFADRIYEGSLPITHREKLIDSLQSKDFLRIFYKAHVWLISSHYIQGLFSDIVSKFVADLKPVVDDYFKCQIDLNQLAKSLSQFIYRQSLVFDQDTLIKELSYGDNLVESHLNRFIRKHLKNSTNISLLGFGGGTGYYEKKTADYLQDNNLCQKVSIYIFEPFKTASLKENIQFINSVTIDQNLKFDLIIARLVLHHIDPKRRWIQFLECCNKLKPDGSLIIIEEGNFLQSKELKQLLYNFFLMCMDVIINMGLRPSWFLSTLPEIGKNFYVNYMVDADIKNIEKEFHFEFDQFVEEITDGSCFSQCLLAYKRKNK